MTALPRHRSILMALHVAAACVSIASAACGSCDAAQAERDASQPDAMFDAGMDSGVPVIARDAACVADDAQPSIGELPTVDASSSGDLLSGFANGPILGAVTDTSVKVWIRTSVQSDWWVDVWPTSDPTSVTRFDGAPLVSRHDFVGVVQVTRLSPDTHYSYRVELADQDSDAGMSTSVESSFRTLGSAGTSGRVRFAVGADIKGGGRQPIFADLLAVDPDFVLLIGDQVYADIQSPDYVGYATKYAGNWNIRHLRELLTQVPAFMTWDDHDIVDNYYAGRSPRYAPARLAYEMFVHAHNPPAYNAGTLYYSFDARDVAFFVLDTRTFRSNFTLPDGAGKTMLGLTQLNALLDWLRCSDARLKVIVSSVPFSDWADSNDAWKGYATEREQIFSFIADHRIDDVLLISGDQHWSAVFVEARHGHQFVELLPTPLSKTRIEGPSAATTAIVARDDDHFVFGVVDVDTSRQPATIDFTLCAEGLPCDPGNEPDPGSALDQPPEADNVPFTLHFTTEDLGPHR